MTSRSVQIVPSILSADFGRLTEHVQEAQAAGIETVQIDVMDGCFVPNITVGLPIVRALKASTDVRLDVHLMIERPERFIDAFAAAGADVLTVHVEASPHLHRSLSRIRELGIEAGAAINPSTPTSAIEDVLHLVDLALVMTVNPGFGGQAFIPEVLPKVTRLRRLFDERSLPGQVQVDGGIGVGTIAAAVQAGASQCVAGSAVFAAGKSVADAVSDLLAAIK